MANKKKNKIVAKKENVKPAKAKNKINNKPTTKISDKKQVKVQKVKVNSVSKAVAKENKKTYNIFGYEVKKSYVWTAVVVFVLLCVLF